MEKVTTPNPKSTKRSARRDNGASWPCDCGATLPEPIHSMECARNDAFYGALAVRSDASAECYICDNGSVIYFGDRGRERLVQLPNLNVAGLGGLKWFLHQYPGGRVSLGNCAIGRSATISMDAALRLATGCDDLVDELGDTR